LIYYQYSKIVARSAFRVSNGKEAKSKHYGFIKKTFRELKSGIKSWSEITRENRQFVEVEKRCVYCGAENDLHWEHIVPKSLRVKPECETCETIQGIHNQIWACNRCNSLKWTKGFYGSETPSEARFLDCARNDKGERKFYDLIPPLLEKKYLKTIINCHECAETLSSGDLNHDGELTVLDIDVILHKV